jgi:hypothetical protein
VPKGVVVERQLWVSNPDRANFASCSTADTPAWIEYTVILSLHFGRAMDCDFSWSKIVLTVVGLHVWRGCGTLFIVFFVIPSPLHARLTLRRLD